MSPAAAGKHLYLYLAVLLFAGAVYLGCIVSPPSLMDDVDAVQAQIARNMLTSGDWVTARLDGVPYLEKAPLIYWTIAVCLQALRRARLGGAHSRGALRHGAVLADRGLRRLGLRQARRILRRPDACPPASGLFLFTRVLIPDVMLTLTVALAMWAFLRALDEAGAASAPAGRSLLAASLGVGLLLKSTVGVLFPVAAGVDLSVPHRPTVLAPRRGSRLHPLSGLAIVLLIAAPWHVLATLRNPPYFDFTLRSVPGEYHGFLWFFFINEQVLRFLNLRYPRDYNTVPRLYFWLFHLLWLFPWSVYFPAVAKLSFKPVDRAGRTRLLALCWTGFVLVFFTFSTTQEYYSMPCYPALALLLGSAMARAAIGVRRGTRVLSAVAGLRRRVALIAICWSWCATFPRRAISRRRSSQHPGTYTLSLGHMEDLTHRVVRVPALAAGAGRHRVSGGRARDAARRRASAPSWPRL